MATTLYPGTAQASLTWTVTGSLLPQTVTCGLLMAPGSTAAQIRTNWDIAMWGAAKPFAAASMANEYTLVESRVILNVGGVLTVDVGTPALVGTGGFASPSPNTPIIIAKNTLFAGPRNRGRLFAPAGCIADSEVSIAGVLAPGTITGLQTKWNAAFASLVANSVSARLLHGPLISSTPLTGFTVTPLIGTLRRRIRR